MTEPTIDWGNVPYRAAELLHRLHNNTITAEEREELHALIPAPLRQRLLAELKDIPALDARMARLARFNSRQAWEQVLAKRTAQRKRTLRQRYAWAAAAVTGIAVFTWFFSGNQQSFDAARIVADNRFGHENDVLPGTSRAELILSNGKAILLQSNHLTFEEEDGTRLRSDSGALHYDANAASGETTLYNTLRVPVAGTYRIVLPDGTAVWLNAASELQFPVRFTGNKRTVTLRGEGYFEVAKDAQKPFSVQVNGDTLAVLGTTFNISAYDPSRTTTSLMNGKVAVAARKGKKVLEPGQAAVSTAAALKVGKADLEKATAWKNGYFYFNNESITEIMDQVARWYGITVRYSGDVPKGQHIGGSISREASLGEVLEQLHLISGLHFSISGSELTISTATKK